MRVGSITAIVGPMFSGKTSALQELARRAALSGNILYLIPACDTRYDAHPTTPLNKSHDGTAVRAVRIQGSIQDLMPPDDASCIFIDEAQFVHGIERYVLRARDAGKHVFFACLRTDYAGSVWYNTNNLISAHATNVVIKTGVCIVCSGDAHYTRLKANSIRGAQQKELIGGDELYACACHVHIYEPATLDEETINRRDEAVKNLK